MQQDVLSFEDSSLFYLFLSYRSMILINFDNNDNHDWLAVILYMCVFIPIAI